MEKKMAIVEFLNKMNEEGFDTFDMFCCGGTSFVFEVEDLRNKAVYLDGDTIVLTDKKLKPCMGCESHAWDPDLIIGRIEAAGLDKDPSLIKEDILKVIFKVKHEGRLYIREDGLGHIEALAGFELEA